MKKPNPEHIEKLCSIINTSPYPYLLSMKLSDIGIGYAKVELEVEKKHRQLMGVVHGGVFAALIDTVTFWAVYYAIDDPGAWVTSVDLKINYLAAASSGKLIATGRQLKVGKTLCYADAEIRNGDGKLMTHGSSTLMILHGKELTDHVLVTPKFIGG